jgi:amino acid permease
MADLEFTDDHEGSPLKGEANDDALSTVSKSDNFNKTSFFMTTVNISKLYMGIGVLAFPFGFQNCGLIFTAGFIMLVTIINTYSQMIQIKCKEKFKNCKTLSDLSYEVYGDLGKQVAAINIISITVLCCMAYVLFFIEQLDWVLTHSTEGVWTDNKNGLFICSLMILTVIYMCESMETLSYISMFAMISLVMGLFLVMYGATQNITEP